MAEKKNLILDGNKKWQEVIDSSARTAIAKLWRAVASLQSQSSLPGYTQSNTTGSTDVSFLASDDSNVSYNAIMESGGTVDLTQALQQTGTANSTDTQLYLVGAATQADSAQTATNENCYIGTDNCLYSNGSKVLTEDGATLPNDYVVDQGTTSGTYTVGGVSGSMTWNYRTWNSGMKEAWTRFSVTNVVFSSPVTVSKTITIPVVATSGGSATAYSASGDISIVVGRYASAMFSFSQQYISTAKTVMTSFEFGGRLIMSAGNAYNASLKRISAWAYTPTGSESNLTVGTASSPVYADVYISGI